MRMFSCEFSGMIMMRIILFVLCLVSSVPFLYAQNLYINNTSVWYSSNSVYCNDIDMSFTTSISYFNIPVSGKMYRPLLMFPKVYTDSTGFEANNNGNATVATCKLGGPWDDPEVNGNVFQTMPVGTVSGYMTRNSTITGWGGGTTTTFTGNFNYYLKDTGADGVLVACRSQAGSTSYSSSNWSSTLNSHFETGGNAPWTIKNGYLVSGSVGNSQYSELATRRYFTSPGYVVFRSSVSSENNFDYLMFYIDGELKNKISGEHGFTTFSFPVEYGVHTLRWVYGKDGSTSAGGDNAAIESITMPANYLTYSENSPYSYYSGSQSRTDSNATATVLNGTDLHVAVSSTVILNPSSPLVCTYGRQLCSPGTRRYIMSSILTQEEGSPYIVVDTSRLVSTGPASGEDVFKNVVRYAEGTNNVSFYGSDPVRDSALIEFDQPRPPYPAACLSLCASVQCASSTSPITFGVDEMTFEIFKFRQGTNPLDPSSAPPIKTIPIYNLGSGHRCEFNDAASTNKAQNFGTFCAAWDGFYNLNGEFGKTNGQYGFRAKVKTSQMTSQGTQVDIEQTSAYPGQNQIPIQINVTDIHNVISSVTAVGKATVVPAQPYNFKYQLSKDATVTIKIYATDETINCANGDGTPYFDNPPAGTTCLVRTIIDSQPKVGEGNTSNPIANGDFWDGRNEHGNMVPPGAYIARFTAASNDEWGTDIAYPATRQMTLDPLQITDIGTRPLGAYSTSYATLSYVLTEAATVFVRIYKPGTVFSSINGTGWSIPGELPSATLLVREMQEEKQARTTVNTIWDGRDSNGVPVCDGNYVYAIYAMMPSKGQLGNINGKWDGVYTRKLYVGTLPVIRGDAVSTFSPSSTVIGSSPTAAGLEPFYFTYTPVRDAIVNLKIKKADGTTIIRKIVNNEVRAARFQNKDIWDGTDDSGRYVSSGTYIAELETIDPYNCSQHKVSTRTAIIPVDLFRTVDVRVGSLLSSASSQASISYQLSETMNMDFKIYEAGTNLNPNGWPDNVVPAGSNVVYSLSGVRPKRMNITEYWDGKDNNGNMKPDGVYPYVLKVYSNARGDQGPIYSTDKTFGYITISRGQILFNKFDVYPTIPTTYNSSEAVHLPPYSIEYSLSRQSTVTVRVVDWLSPSIVYADVVLGENRDANTQYTDYWDGKCTRNVGGEHPCTKYDFVADGSYKIQVIAEDADQVQALRQPATAFKVIDVAPLKIFDVSIREVGPDTPGVISYQVSEPMKVVTKIYEPGTNITGFQEPNGLVKRLIGVRSARTPVNEIWDGTDLSMFPVDDGTYVFSIFGTTVTAAISGLDGSITGDIRMDYDTELYNLPSAYTIPVARSGSIDVCGSFENDSYFAPNPYTGNNGWFRIPVKAIGNVTLKIYNLAGDLVYSRDYGKRGADESINGKGKCSASHTHEACWPKVNNSGRELARGVYFAVLRFEAAEGSKAVCQTVKKILIP